MSMEFGKLNFAVGFNRTSAFPLDANSYFENYDAAVTAAAGAAEVGSSDSAYYVGQLIIVKDTTKGVGLYQISADKTLVKFGQASSADELTTDLATLKVRFNNLVRDLPATEGEDGAFTLLEPSESTPLGFFSNDEKTKLAGIATGAQVNKLESVKVDGTALTIDENKAVNIDLSAYAKTADMDKKVASVAAEDGSIAIGGTATAPTVKVAIAAGEDNALTLAADGLKVVVPAAAEYSIAKLEAANEGMSASYQLTKDGKNVGAIIDIPKDMVVKSGTVETYKAGSLPTGVAEAGTYIVLTLANATEDKLYINVGGLIEYVTGGSAPDDAIQVNVASDTHKVTASVKDGSIALGKLATAVQTKINQAHEHANKAELDKIKAGDVVLWDAEKGAMAKATANAAAIEALEAVKPAEAGAQVNKIESIKVGTEALPISSKSVTLPIATASSLGLVKVDNTSIEINDEGTIGVKALNVNKLFIAEGDTLVLDGGNSSL